LYAIEKGLKEEQKEKSFSKACSLINFDDLAQEFLIEYVDKVEKYYPLFKSVAQKVREFSQNGFIALDRKDKCQYIANLLIVTARGSGRVDMPQNWNGGSSWGRLKDKTIVPNQVDWINQSITGYYTSVIPSKK